MFQGDNQQGEALCINIMVIQGTALQGAWSVSIESKPHTTVTFAIMMNKAGTVDSEVGEAEKFSGS